MHVQYYYFQEAIRLQMVYLHFRLGQYNLAEHEKQLSTKEMPRS